MIKPNGKGSRGTGQQDECPGRRDESKKMDSWATGQQDESPETWPRPNPGVDLLLPNLEQEWRAWFV
jgi:hypothetical protein